MSKQLQRCMRSALRGWKLIIKLWWPASTAAGRPGTDTVSTTLNALSRHSLQVATFETGKKTGAAAALGATEAVVTLRKQDLDRMLKNSPIMTAEDVAAAKKAADAKREQAQAVSKARKERMIKLEEEARKQAPPTETALLKQKQDLSTLSRAQHLLQEEKDDVKRMNQMMLYSKCVTIRDAQIEEKRQMMQEAEEENRKQDLMMEIERLKALEEYELRERQRLEEQRKGAKVLEEQIAEREKERIRQEELRDQERIQMLKEIERLKEMELQAQIEKKLQAKELMEQVAAANSEQIKRKELMKIREKQEEVKITQYIRAKEAREQVCYRVQGEGGEGSEEGGRSRNQPLPYYLCPRPSPSLSLLSCLLV